ncbi:MULTISPECIES: acyl-CoA thioester hydrolase/BAAT C-terminal domain-containing protein [unclassified Nocardioides]|uniref:acyl-CoA thioester hydrolase/BAAT C-terminal domain-containing protein n=1 Tax=unclassified Nocardioides TaxID=2615069 RepID=UPI0009F14CC3|nr:MULTISPECIES: acyl-CoA thioester hydrolase/BAAT C-terminal domain-containing protein [unclassified Nocardioides]GAW49131.1 Acyl-CoA thioesterase [Nocardioides sp. PD653-B2]GAW56710.1 Acyl-CoA thioesterase [Nocardioides sp. PD653]
MFLVGDGPTGVLVLAGSSGRVEEDRCRVLAAAGATAASYRWFGETVDLVALESFDDPLATLHERCDRLVVLGTSRGAEAALLLGAMHPEIDAVVAISPSDVVWASLSSERPQRSSWMRGGEPLPFVPYDDSWEPDTDPPEFLGQYEQALEKYADRVPASWIPVERIAGEVLLTAGGDDRVWPAVDFADQVAARREAAGLATTVLVLDHAGHRLVLPGEAPAPPPRFAHGGTLEADSELGLMLWPHLLRLLGA